MGSPLGAGGFGAVQSSAGSWGCARGSSALPGPCLEERKTFWGHPCVPGSPRASQPCGIRRASGCGWAEPNLAQGGIQNLNLQMVEPNKEKPDPFYCYAIRTPLICVSPAQLLLALPEFEDVPMNNLQTYNTKGMKTDNAIYFALMSSRQW